MNKVIKPADRKDPIMEKKKKIRGVIFALLSGICWSYSGTIGQYLFSTKNIDAGWLSVMRLFLSGLFLFAVALWKKPAMLKKMWSSLSDVLYLILYSVFGLMLMQYSYLMTISYSNSGIASALQYAGEALVLVLTCIKVRRFPRVSESVGLMLMLIGLFLFATHGRLGSFVMTEKIAVWGTIAAVSMMLYTVLPSRIISKYGNLASTASGMMIGSAVLAVMNKAWQYHVVFDRELVFYMVLIIFIGTVSAYYMFMQSIMDIGPARTGMLSSVETISSPLFSAVWLKTAFTAADCIGFCCMFAMVIMISWSALKQNHVSNVSSES